MGRGRLADDAFHAVARARKGRRAQTPDRRGADDHLRQLPLEASLALRGPSAARSHRLRKARDRRQILGFAEPAELIVGDRFGLSHVMPVAVFPRERAPALLRRTREDCAKLLERNLQALTDRIRTKRVIRVRRRSLHGAAATRFGKTQLPQESVYHPDDVPSVAVLAHAYPPSRAGPGANPRHPAADSVLVRSRMPRS